MLNMNGIKVDNFRSHTSQRMCPYLLTPRGIEEKARVTARFLRKKLDECDAPERELEELRHGAARVTPTDEARRG